PNLTAAVRQGADLVVAVGFLMGDALATVAQQFPDTSFAIVDYSDTDLAGDPTNVRGLVFAEQESGYLAGVAAASVADGGSVSAIGGQAVPAVVSFLAGYREGAKAEKPGITVLQGYSQDFVDQAKCAELALNQVARGSEVVFAAAGGCGLGAISAAKDRGVWAIGVDNDQSFLGPHILTSATKKVDVAVFETIQSVVDGTFEGGADTLFDLANGGVGYGEVSADAPDRDALIEKLDDVSKQIADGAIDVPRS
ncbi:MAG TPA: BMP family ABC transporter substrate-binding protein, partial [Gaiella sp.]